MLTQQVAADLAGKQVVFTPIADEAKLKANPDYETAIASLDTVFPTASSDALTFEDGVAVVELDAIQIVLFGEAYDTVYVGTDGRVSVAAPEAAAKTLASLLDEHFAAAGISGALTDADLAASVYAEETDDGLSVLYDGAANDFVVTLLTDGTIAVSWYALDAELLAVTGLSNGGALPARFKESDFLKAATTDPIPAL